MTGQLELAAILAIGGGLALAGAPGWLALALGLVLALATGRPAPARLKQVTTLVLQLGVVALGAGMNLALVWQVGARGMAITVAGLVLALGLGQLLGRWLRVGRETALLIGVGTAICGGSAIVAVAGAIDADEHDTSISLVVVFVLNAVGLVLFPWLGHLLALPEPVFGRWAALAIHDTSSVVGAALAYGPTALAIATTTKLARALWIVPTTLVVAMTRRHAAGAALRRVRWPWFILGFVAVAAATTWIPGIAAYAAPVVRIGRGLLVVALLLIGRSLSRAALAQVGVRPVVLGVVLWVVVAAASLGLAGLGSGTT